MVLGCWMGGLDCWTGVLGYCFVVVRGCWMWMWTGVARVVMRRRMAEAPGRIRWCCSWLEQGTGREIGIETVFVGLGCAVVVPEEALRNFA